MKNRKTLLIVIVLDILINFCLLTGLGHAEMLVNYDYTVFPRDSNTFLLEFYYFYPETEYTMQMSNSKGYYGNINFKIMIRALDILDTLSTSNDFYKEVLWRAPIEKKIAGEDLQDFYGLQKIYLHAGKYTVLFEGQDEFDTSNKFNKKFDLIIEPNTTNGLSISGLQIANNIISKFKISPDIISEFPDIFYKNQFYVYPNPLREISSDYPTLHLYSEINNIKVAAPNGIKIKYIIYDATNRPVLNYEREKPATADAIVETISVPLDTYQSGVYYAEINISPNNKLSGSGISSTVDTTLETISRKTKFFLINRNIELKGKTMYTDDEMFERSEFATYSENRANSEFEKFNIIATSQERKSWDKLTDLKAKQRFLYRFWFMRNPDQSSEFNIELQKFRQRIEHVNTYYSYGGKTNGWKTDRGKVYVRYGEPDQIDKNSSTPDKKAYDAWYYTGIDGGGEFYFIDKLGMGDYVLVHSTAFGYIQNFNWYEIVTGTTNTNKY